jgi:hypothetical protein
MQSNNKDSVLMPLEVVKKGDTLWVACFRLPRMYYREPFFIETIATQFPHIESHIKLPEENEPLARPLAYDSTDPRVVEIPLTEFLAQYGQDNIHDKLRFIFHISRCGSTLAAQMLAQNNRFFVLSEPMMINAILDPALPLTEIDRGKLLTATIAALVSCAPVSCEYTFIKFRSWNSLFLHYILKEFPTVKWIFIHRYGLEVLSSVLEKPPGWLRSKVSYANYLAPFLQSTAQEIKEMQKDEFIARILGAFCRIAQEAQSENGLYVDYVHLKHHFFDTIMNHWGIELSEAEKMTMMAVSNLYSKDAKKQQSFVSDSAEKKLKASPKQHDLITTFVESQRKRLVTK